MTRLVLLSLLALGAGAGEPIWPLALPPSAEELCTALDQRHGIEPKEGDGLLATIDAIGEKVGVRFELDEKLRETAVRKRLSRTDTLTLTGTGWTVVWTLRRLYSVETRPREGAGFFVPRGTEGAPACAATFIDRGILSALTATARVRVSARARRKTNRERMEKTLAAIRCDLAGEVRIADVVEALSGEAEVLVTTGFEILSRGRSVPLPGEGGDARAILDRIVEALPGSEWTVHGDGVTLCEKPPSRIPGFERPARRSRPAHVRSPRTVAELRRQLHADGFRLLWSRRFAATEAGPFPSPREGESVCDYVVRLFPLRDGYEVVWCLEHVAVFRHDELR